MGERIGLTAPSKAMGRKLGAVGKRVVSVLTTSSLLMVMFFCQEEKPSFLSSTKYLSGLRVRVVFVADLSSPLIQIWAPSGIDVATRSPVPSRRFLVKSSR